MRIFFGCTSEELVKYQEYYSAIRNLIVIEGHILTRDWYPPALELAKKGIINFNQKNAFGKVVTAMEEADVIIVEDTISNFSTGYQITYALQHNKPILVLWSEHKKKYASMTFLHGLSSDYLEISRYDLNNIEEIICGFLNKYSNANQKHRFHLVIDEVERKYLDWAKYQQKESRTKIIRQAIREKLNRDKAYSSYLKNTDK